MNGYMLMRVYMELEVYSAKDLRSYSKR